MKTYSPKRAWIIALVYFAVCISISAHVGELQALMSTPLASESQVTDSYWCTATLLVSAYAIFAYGYFWPKGTLTYGRPLHIGWALLFGVLWGACEGQLVLVAYRVVESAGLPSRWTVSLMFVGYSFMTSIWHQRFWDIHVAPRHNIFEWNIRKVAIAHAPFLLLILVHLATYNNALLFVSWQIIALTLSTLYMRFPAPGDPEAPAHDAYGFNFAY